MSLGDCICPVGSPSGERQHTVECTGELANLRAVYDAAFKVWSCAAGSGRGNLRVFLEELGAALAREAHARRVR
jgi:hypothetical protein